MKNLFTYCIYLLFSLGVLIANSCIREDLFAGGGTDLGDEIEFTIAYKIPGVSTVTTRLESEEQQKVVSRVDVIVYKVGADNIERVAYHRGSFDLSDNKGSGSFKVRLAKSAGNEKYTFDFIFNAENLVLSPFHSGTLKIGSTREEVAQAIRHNNQSMSIGSNGVVPMWATYKDPVQITKDTSLGVLEPIRVVARLDFGLNLDSNDIAQGLPNFELTYVGFMCGSAYGYHIPEPDNFDFALKRVTAPSLRGSSVSTTASVSLATTANRLIGGMFPCEIDPYKTYSGRTFCVFVGGTYTDPVTGTVYENQYYRIDLMDPDDPDRKLPILRNHRYRINILGVDAPGVTVVRGTSINAAQCNTIYNAGPANVRYELTVAEEGDINHVVYTNQYMLGVSDVSLSYPGTAATHEIKVLTDYAGGWTASIEPDKNNNITPDWITLSPASGLGNIKETLTFQLKASATNDPRVAVVTLRAGTLSIDVQITQYGNFFVSTNYKRTLMLGDGDSWEVYVWGNVPAELKIRAWSEREAMSDPLNNYPARAMDVCFERATVPAGNYPESSKVTRTLDILGNAWLPMDLRQVQLQYSIDNGATWHLIEEGPQGKGHYRLQVSGRIVGLYDFESTETTRLTWVQAMGLEYHWRNNHLFRGEGKTNYPYKLVDRHNYYYVPDGDPSTGCLAYMEEGYESKYPKGNWRLPSQAEVQEMALYYEHIGHLAEEGMYYWTSTEQQVSHSGAHAVRIVYGTIPGDEAPDKENYAHPIRCVYGDPDPYKITPPSWWVAP